MNAALAREGSKAPNRARAEPARASVAFSFAAMPTEGVRPGLDARNLQADDRFVRALIRRFVADPQLAEDLAQDTWLAALRHASGAGFFERAWLGTVARNFVFQALRGKARRAAREQAVARALEVEPDDDVALDVELRRRVLAAVDTLDEPYRSVIRLRFFEDLPPTQIAERLGQPVETVRTRLKRALVRVHAQMRAVE